MDDSPTPFEDRLRSALAAGIAQTEAESGAPVADPADLARRRVEHHRRQRTGRVAAAAVLVVLGVLGGWALTRGDDDGGQVEEVAGVPTTILRPAYEGESDTTVAIDPAPDPSRVLEVPGQVPVVVPQPPDPGTDSGAAARSAAGAGAGHSYSPEGFWYDGAELPRATLSTRELADGTTVQVQANRYDPAIYELPPFWAPPAWCFPIGDVTIGLDRIGETTRTVRYAASEDGTVMARSTIVGGDDEAAPRWLTVVHGPAGTATVRVTFPGGQEDVTAPVDGIAVLSVPVREGFDLGDDQTVTAVALASDGTELARHEGPRSEDALGEPLAEPPHLRPACAVPTELPAPGPEQPADPGAAETALRQSWDRAFGDLAGVTTAEQLEVVADTRGVGDALDRSRELVSPEVMAQTSIEIDGVVFASPERAFVHYTVDIATGTYADLFGELVLVDGSWKVTRKTACDLAETGGGICQPLPPS